MSDSSRPDGPYELTWNPNNIPPLYAKEPGGVVLRVTYWNRRTGGESTEVKLYAQASAYFGHRKLAVQHRLCTLDFKGIVIREKAEPLVLPLVDICAIRFELTIRKVDWWGPKGERKGNDETV